VVQVSLTTALFRPNVGGPVGLADLYVDEALVRKISKCVGILVSLHSFLGICNGYVPLNSISYTQS
jgi:hypothetical protein